MDTNIVERVEGDTYPPIDGTIYKDDGVTPEDITDWDIKLHIGYETPLIKTATIPFGVDGYFKFVLEPTDLRAGRFSGEIQVETVAGIKTYQDSKYGDQLQFDIAKQIA